MVHTPEKLSPIKTQSPMNSSQKKAALLESINRSHKRIEIENGKIVSMRRHIINTQKDKLK